jgi:hypothetical protein
VRAEIAVDADEIVTAVMRRLVSGGLLPETYVALLLACGSGDLEAIGLANLAYLRDVIATTVAITNEIAAGAREIRALTEPDRHRPTAPDVSE